MSRLACMMIRPVFLYVGLLWLSGVRGDGLTLQKLQDTFSNSGRGVLICYYDGSACKRDSQVCDPQSRTCEPIALFEEDATDERKLKICTEYVNNDTVSDPQVYDACIYIIGKMKAEDRVGCDVNLPLTRPVGDDLCPYYNPAITNGHEFFFCKRGKEFCTQSGCEPLFDAKSVTSDDDKRKYCLEEVKKNQTTNKKYDSCLYALGSLGSLTDEIKKLLEESQNDGNATLQDLKAKIDMLKKKVDFLTPCNNASFASDNSKEIGLAVGLAVAGVVIVGLVLALVWKRKRLCFRTANNKENVNPEDPPGCGNDENLEELPNPDNEDLALLCGNDQAKQNDMADGADDTVEMNLD